MRMCLLTSATAWWTKGDATPLELIRKLKVVKHSEAAGRLHLGCLSLGKGVSPHIFIRETGAGRGIDCHAGYNEKHGFEDELRA